MPDAARAGLDKWALVRVGPLTVIPALISRLGHDPQTVLADTGIYPSLLADQENSISFPALCGLLDVCSRRLACAHFGVLLGEQVELRHLGLLGVLMRLSRDVGEALQLLARYQGYQTQVNDLTLDVGAQQIVLSYRGPSGVVGADKAADGILAGLCSLLRILCGPGWSPTQVFFAHPMPAEMTPFGRHFRCPLVFSARDHALAFPVRHLEKPLANVESELLDVVAWRVERESFPADGGFTSRTYKAIETAIRSGKVSSEIVAASLGVHVRTLSRHLDRRGLRFQAMLDGVRRKAAARMLADPRLTVAYIANCLGYANAASFVRAFRRWHDVTPAEWRMSGRCR